MSKRPYVVHYCKNKRCESAWLDVDETNVSSRPPQYKYCAVCELNGHVTVKDEARVARGKALAERMRKRNDRSVLEDL